MGKVLALDFDGVIHKYSGGYKDGSIYDDPMEGAVEGITKLKEAGYELIIYTTRPNIEDIKKWLMKHIGFEIEIADRKPKAMAYIDDRGIRFTNWKDVLNYFR